MDDSDLISGQDCENVEVIEFESKRQRLNSSQFAMMVDFMTLNPDLINRKVSDTFTKEDRDKKWEELASLLNADFTGAKKDAERWKRSWQDQKYIIQVKAAKRDSSGSCKLTELEERVLKLIESVNSERGFYPNESWKDQKYIIQAKAAKRDSSGSCKLTELEERVLKLIGSDNSKRRSYRNEVKSLNIKESTINSVPKEMGLTNYVFIGLDGLNVPVRLEPINLTSLKLDTVNNPLGLQLGNVTPIRLESSSNLPLTSEATHSVSTNLVSMNNLAPDVNCIPLKPGSSADSSTVDQIEDTQESREKESSTLIVKLQSDAAAPKTVSEEVRKYRGVAKKKVQKLNNAVHLKTRSNSTILRKKYDALRTKMRMKELGNTQTDYSQSMPADYSSTEQLLSEAHSGISENSRSSSGSESVQELVTEVTEENINDTSSQNSYSNTPKKKMKISNHSNFERMDEFGMIQLLQRQNKLLEGIAGTLKRIEKSLDDRSSREVQRKSSMLVYISENVEKLAESLGGVSKSLKTIAEK